MANRFFFVTVLPCISFFFLSLFLPFALAAAPTSELYEYDNLVLTLHLKNGLAVVPDGGTPIVEKATADLLWYPRDDYRQQVRQVITTPRATLLSGGYHYAWSSPKSSKLDFSLDATLVTSDETLAVTKKLPFPIATIPPELVDYTKPAKLINTDEAIRQQAFALAAGKDDQFEVVYAVADWVTTNIEYNLTSMTMDASQPSTWVMANRQGVCDEMTSLFISMLRSLGIPARFVSGVSYTNLPEFAEPWGGHGWAEVYFPGVGWIPFDVTYGTYGFVDATHIKLQDGVDAGSDSVTFSLLGMNAQLLTQSIDISVDVVDKQRRGKQPFTVALSVFDDVGLASYNLVTATVTNTEDRYLSARFTLSQTEGLDFLSPLDRNVLLHPREMKKFTYLLRTKGLASGFKYDFPIILHSGFREVASTSFEARDGYATYDKSFFDTYLDVGSETSVESPLQIVCPEPNAVYLGSDVAASCTITNSGKRDLSGVQACLLGSCSSLRLAPGTSATITAAPRCDGVGIKASLATAKHAVGSASGLLRYTCIDEAKVGFKSIEMPASLSYDEEGEMTFTVERTSGSLPRKAKIAVIHDNFQQFWETDEISQPQTFTFLIHGDVLDLGENPVTLQVEYEDDLGKKSVTTETRLITTRDFSFFDKVQVTMMNAQRWVEGLFS